MKSAAAKKTLEKAGFSLSKKHNTVTAVKAGAISNIYFIEDGDMAIYIGVGSDAYSYPVSSLRQAIKNAQ